jgi:hypothetical protein
LFKENKKEEKIQSFVSLCLTKVAFGLREERSGAEPFDSWSCLVRESGVEPSPIVEYASQIRNHAAPKKCLMLACSSVVALSCPDTALPHALSLLYITSPRQHPPPTAPLCAPPLLHLFGMAPLPRPLCLAGQDALVPPPLCLADQDTLATLTLMTGVTHAVTSTTPSLIVVPRSGDFSLYAASSQHHLPMVAASPSLAATPSKWWRLSLLMACGSH